MSGPRKVFNFLNALAVAEAQWDCEVSLSILKSRKKMLLVLLLCAPIVLLSIVHAASSLGGNNAYGPSFFSGGLFFASIAIGLVAGLITGCIGAGGGFVITPALMSVGIKGIMAVGTSLFNIFAKAIMGTAVHRKLGNVSLRLAIPFMLGSLGGVYLGGSINRALYDRNPILSDAFISSLYVLLLGLLGFYALYDFLKHRKITSQPGEGAHTYTGVTKLAVKFQSVNIPPMLKFDEDFVPGGKQISWVMLAGGGFFVGALASMMGAGGGFATFPMFVYVFGVSSMTTVGTDILQIIFTAGVASITQYAIYGYIFYSIAMGMLLGSLVGIQIGALTTKMIKGIHIRGFYAVSILAGFIDRLFVLPRRMQQLGVVHLPKAVALGIQHVGDLIFWIVCSIFALWLFAKFISGLKGLREESVAAKSLETARQG